MPASTALADGVAMIGSDVGCGEVDARTGGGTMEDDTGDGAGHFSDGMSKKYKNERK